MATQVARRVAVPASLAARWGLLPSRIGPPAPRSTDVDRARLVAGLMAASAPIVSVVAPGGYGKSTLLAQFVERDPRPCAWLDLARDADEPAALARYLAYALDAVLEIDDELVDELDGLNPRMRVVTAGLAAAIHRAEQPFLFVVDDVHVLRDRRCFSVLRTVAREIPRGSVVAFVARNETPLSFGRARAAGELHELGIDDMRFEVDDAAQLLRSAGAATIDVDTVARLTDETEGWAVGLYLAGRSSRLDPGSIAPTFGGDDRFVADYVRETMLDELPETDRAFLVQTSILEELSAPLCDAALDVSGSGAMLDSLVSSNLLVVPLDHRRGRYRYHHLFRDVLRAELDRRSPALVPAITGRASSWCEREGQTDQAVAYAIAGRHVDRTAELVARFGQAAYYGGRASLVRSWLEWLGANADISTVPIIAVLGAWLHTVEGSPVEAERWADAIAPADLDDPATHELEGIRSLLLAAMTRDGPERMLEDAERASSLLATGSAWRSNAHLFAGLAHLCGGDLDAASSSFERGAEVAHEMGVTIGCAVAHAELAIVALATGDTASATLHAATSRRIVEEGRLQGYPISTIACAVSARVALVQGDPLQARATMTEASVSDRGLTYALPTVAVQVDVLLARCAMGLGDATAAHGWIQHGADIVGHRPHLGLLASDLDAAREELDALRASAIGLPSLTPAESRLLPQLTSHRSFREIGQELYISPHTVKTQAISIYRKLGVSSRGEAVRVAREIGLLAP